jgi:transposase
VFPLALLPDSVGLALQHTVLDAAGISFFVQTTAATAPCPRCAQLSHRVHSYYQRHLADLPWRGRAAHLYVRVRRFFCSEPSCPRRIFAERLPALAASHRRTTTSLEDAHRHLGFALGGEAGARLACRLGMHTSPDTLLRRVHSTPTPPPVVPRILGVDDWAWRKGRVYGTILCDLERHCPIELLPDREAGTLKTWLEAHPGVEIISRDRAGAYAQGARSGAPNAVQVADRWHLLHNLRETVQRLLDRQRPLLRATAEALAEKTLPAAPDSTEINVSPPLTRKAIAQQARRQRRLDRYTEVVELHRHGVTEREIARQLKLSRNTVHKYVCAAAFPERTPERPRPSCLAPHVADIQQRWEQGCRNAAQITRELQARGHRVSYGIVQQYLKKLRRHGGTPLARATPPSPRRLSWLLLDVVEDVSPEEERFRAALCERDADVCGVAELARQFVAMVREQKESELEDWLCRAQADGRPPEMRGFATSLRQDQAAVAAALRLSWSNGQVEGQINRLKTIKRQMYGRAGFDLLRQRVLRAG